MLLTLLELLYLSLKRSLEKIADHIQDSIIHNNSEYIQWYLISVDITESKLYTEKPASTKKSTPKYKFDIKFKNKGLDFNNVARILLLSS